MKNRKMGIVLIMLVSLSLVLTSCILEKDSDIEEGNFPVTIVDASGKEIIINERPKSISSLSKNNTEILFELGLDEEIVGVTKFCDYPVEALAKDKVRDLDKVDVAKIVELKTDLVVEYGTGTSKVRKELEDKGITVISFHPETMEEIAETIKIIGKAVGKEDEGIKISEDISTRFESIVNLTKDSDKVKVFFEEWSSPLLTAGKGTSVDYLIEKAGGENIGRDAGTGYPEFSLEELIEKNPDIYIAKNEEKNTIDSIREREGYDKIKAIKEYDVHLVEGDILTIPGPRFIDALEMFFEAINPELAYGDI